MVFCGSGGIATEPLAGAAAVGAAGAFSWPTSGCFGSTEAGVLVFLVFFAEAVAGALVDLALSFLRQELRELEVLRLWQ